MGQRCVNSDGASGGRARFWEDSGGCAFFCQHLHTFVMMAEKKKAYLWGMLFGVDKGFLYPVLASVSHGSKMILAGKDSFWNIIFTWGMLQ